MKKLRPLSNNIILEAVVKKQGGIILPDAVDDPKERTKEGKVVSVGIGRLDKDGKRIPSEIKKGDMVMFFKYGPNEVEVEGKKYLIAKEEDVLAIIE